ncbi:MAG: alpha/beta hydrolase [Armatimonadetes bacterium]|nr:alpha/beta hydrolase [Armatimonadota bacterium]
MTQWQSGEVTANGLRLHYTRTGGDGPAVVLAHGFSDDGTCWTPLAEALAGEYDVIMPDARGHGRSEAPEGPYGTAEQAADLAGLIAALGLTRPAILGHSMGAATTLALAGTHPDVPRAILLEDPGASWMPPPPEPPPGTPDRWAGMRDWVTGLPGKTREELIAGQRAATPGWSEAELGPWADSKLRLSPHVLNRADAAPIDWPAILRRITCPVLLITADPARGGIISDESAAALQSFVPHVRRAHIPEAGHSVRRDQFAPYLAAVRAFLRETDPAGA